MNEPGHMSWTICRTSGPQDHIRPSRQSTDFSASQHQGKETWNIVLSPAQVIEVGVTECPEKSGTVDGCTFYTLFELTGKYSQGNCTLWRYFVHLGVWRDSSRRLQNGIFDPHIGWSRVLCHPMKTLKITKYPAIKDGFCKTHMDQDRKWRMVFNTLGLNRWRRNTQLLDYRMELARERFGRYRIPVRTSQPRTSRR